MPTGVEIYSTEIIRALLLEIEKKKRAIGGKVAFRLYTPEWLPQLPRKWQKKLWCPRLWTLLRLSLEILLHPPDLLFIPSHVLPFFFPRRTFVTIHDLAFEKEPSVYGIFQRFYLHWSTQRALKKAQTVIVPTHAVRRDLISILDADPEKIAVIPHGRLPLRKLRTNDVRKILKQNKLAPSQVFFFFLGRLETKKNLLVLLEAWSIVQKMYSNVRLVLAGKPGLGSVKIFDRAQAEDIRGTVIFPGYASEKEVSAFLHSAVALILPSSEEGFGFPVLQAFEAACPVIASNIPALREVGGGAALFADPNNPKDFAEQILKLLENKELRLRLQTSAKAHLQKYSWSKAAQALVSVFGLLL